MSRVFISYRGAELPPHASVPEAAPPDEAEPLEPASRPPATAREMDHLKGQADPGRPEASGDIYLFLTVTRHPLFERRGRDIYFESQPHAGRSATRHTTYIPQRELKSVAGGKAL